MAEMSLEQFVMDFLMQVRPKGMKAEDYPYIVDCVVNMVKLELTKE